MDVEVKIVTEPAETVYINTPKDSYGIFCFNSKGDLFLNSDWGFYGYAWRHFGGDFKAFISQCNADYISDKFEININGRKAQTDYTRYRMEHVKVLVKHLIEYCKSTVNA